MFHGLKQPVLLAMLLGVLTGTGEFIFAADDFDLDAIEAEMNKQGERQAEVAAPVASPVKEETKKPITFQELGKLSAFSDISVIQKKYMPKTKRFQLFGGVDFLTNNPFFDSYGFNGRFSFFLTESIGVELGIWRHSVSPRTITTDLDSKHNITTRTMLSSNGYMGASLLFVPFYGKMTFLDRKIIPYDFYVSVGGGTTETSYLDKSAPSVHLGTGEIFSISKSFAWRWDFSSITYTARAPEVNTDGELTDSGKKQSISDLYLGIGLTILFPGASYR
jgi:outer membrane beta-barrel protein